MRAPTLLAAALLSASQSVSALPYSETRTTPGDDGANVISKSDPADGSVTSASSCNENAVVSNDAMALGGSSGDSSACNVQPGDYFLEGAAYPESCRFVGPKCELVCSQLFDAVYNVYDGVTHTLKRNLSIPETQGNRRFHASGDAYDEINKRFTTLHNDGAPFYTQGQQVDGEDWLAHWDATEDYKLLWTFNLNTETKLSGCRGYQEVTHLEDGSIIAVSTYGGCLVLVSHDDNGVTNTEILYKSKFDENNKPIPAGTGAIGKINATAFLFNDQSAKTLNILNMETKTTTEVKTLNGTNTGDDGLYVPTRYEGNCGVVALSEEGWVFWCSPDGWQSAKEMGKIDNLYGDKNGSATAIYEILTSGMDKGLVYGNYEFFVDSAPGPGGETLPGTRDKFPQQDLTAQLDAFYEKFQAETGETRTPPTTPESENTDGADGADGGKKTDNTDGADGADGDKKTVGGETSTSP